MFEMLISYLSGDVKQVIEYKRQGWRLGVISIYI